MTTEPKSGSITGIGSLPHPNIDSALTYSFSHSLPFLPQIPKRNAWEYMVPQALDGLPGLQVDKEGLCTLDPDVWAGRSRSLDERLSEAFEKSGSLTSFEPSSATSSSWQPFLWECEERGAKLAKIQLCGPVTAQSSLRLSNGKSAATLPELTTQIFRLVLARATAMVRRLKSIDVTPVFFLDEPGLFALQSLGIGSVLLWEELKLTVQALQREGAMVGLHCCSDSDWKKVLGLGIDILSLDAALSLESFLKVEVGTLDGWIKKGGRLSLGIVPAPGATNEALRSLEGRVLLEKVTPQLKQYPQLVETALYTASCGLALHTPEEAEEVLRLLQEVSS